MIPTTGHSVALLAQADALLLAARLLTRPRTEDRITIPGATRSVLARLVGLERRSDALTSFHAMLDAASSGDPDTWAAEHSRLFEGGAACPANESAFVRRDKGAILADVCGFYRAFGFELAPGSGEKADHVVTELEFLALLLVMLARAGERGDRDAEEITRDALAVFASGHLDEWLSLFCQRLEATSTLPLYRRLARYLSGLFETIVEDHDLPRAEQSGGDPEAPDDGTPYECGLAGACGLTGDRGDGF